MTTLTFARQTFRGSPLNGQSNLPAMRWMRKPPTPTDLSEDDELFVNYGVLQEMLPYQAQDRYDRQLQELKLATAVLENDYIKAVFLPEYGGRLWRLYDKKAKRELVSHNPVIRPCNLALRNAWLCGGVEWNIGMTGHSPFTCSPLFAARVTAEDGTPVLRMYEWERRRGVVYQMDFFLPENSSFLYARIRIENPKDHPVPMYWWSNVAVEETEKSRMIVPAEDAYCIQGGMTDAMGGKSVGIVKKPVPVQDETDISYPIHNRHSTDYFFHLASPRRYMTMVQEDGYGLVQTSTSRLKGRKLFVWGQGPGGKHWQKFLTEDGRPYAEIQAGLASTQMECLPMPGKTAWEWIEAYGPIQIDRVKAHGEWNGAQKAVEDYLDQVMPQAKLEDLLRSTKKTLAQKPADALLFSGSGWGALENLRRTKENQPPLCPHLDFGLPGKEQRIWTELLEKGALPKLNPMEEIPSYMIQSQWMELIRQKASHHFAGQLMLGLSAYSQGDMERAQKHFSRSLELDYSPWALVCLAHTHRVKGETALAADLMGAAALLRPDDLSLVKESLFIMAEAKQYRQMKLLISSLPKEIAEVGGVQLRLCQAYLGCGQWKEAEETLYQKGGLAIPDLQEGENSITDLWYAIEKEKAAQKGEPFQPEKLIPPFFADFRMNAH